MKTIFKTIVFSFCTIVSFSQSVTLEPGKSLFDHSLEGTELKGTGKSPVKIKSTDDTLNVDFFSENIYRSRIEVTPYSTAIRSTNAIGLITSGIPRLWIDSQGKVGISDNYTAGTYRLTVRSNDEYTAAFFSNAPFGKATINFNNNMFLETSTALGTDFYGANGYSFRSFNSGDFRFSSNNIERFRIMGVNGNVGIGVFDPSSKLEVNGDIKSSNLAFSGISDRRPVFANQNGILSIDTTSNHYLSLGVSEIQYVNDLIFTNFTAHFSTSNSVKVFYIPVKMPDNVVVKEVKFHYIDNSPSNLLMQLNRIPLSEYSLSGVASAVSSGSIAEYSSINASLTNANTTIDNRNYTYYITVLSINGNWTSNTLRFAGARITYQYQ